VDAGGNIVLGWGAFDYESAVGYRPMLTRFHPDGSLDTSFGNGGTADVQVGITYGSTYGLSVDAAGHYLLAPTLAGGNDADFGLVSVKGDGSLDLTFGTGGVVRTDVSYGDEARTILNLPGGDVLLAGHATATYASNLAAFVRYNADGSLEQGFGGPADETIYGWLTASDPDDTAGSLSWSGSANGVYGSFVMDSGGTWTYTVDNSRAATQNLGADQAVTETFTATVRDSSGATASQQITVTVVGVYDTPVS
jgi:VCBS repeat-containing protein